MKQTSRRGFKLVSRGVLGAALSTVPAMLPALAEGVEARLPAAVGVQEAGQGCSLKHSCQCFYSHGGCCAGAGGGCRAAG